jgi:uncharacterized protein
VQLSAAEARRIALAAQGFARPRPEAVSARAVTATVEKLGLLQIDSVNVLSRAHYLPLFARLGPYDRDVLDRAAHYAPRRLFEYWGHEASLIPVTTQPLLRWRMERARHEAWGGMRRIAQERPELLERIVEEVRERGPLPASAIAEERPRRSGPWWDWSDVKRGFEFLFWSGRLTSARRRGFERYYDLPERVLPKAVVDAPTPSEPDAIRGLLAIGARAMGIATASDLRDYFRLPAEGNADRIAELVEAGELTEIAVEGWPKPGYLAAGARIPRSIDAAALIGPFDSLIWERPRVERVFGFRYRIEIYVPEPKRVHGYYVLPFLLGDRLVARVDLKADRQEGVLRVQAAHMEPGAPPETPEALRRELDALAAWLGGLDGGVVVMPRGDLAPALAAVA